MRLDSKLLSLPASILLLVASHSKPLLAANSEKAAARWPLNILSNLNYWPGSSANKDVEATEDCMNGRRPAGVMKMSDDEGEKFYMEYWQFEGNAQHQSPILSIDSSSSLRSRDLKEEARLRANASMPISYRPPFAMHTDSDFSNQDLKARRAVALALLEGRDFTCPTGTASCSAVGYPNSCCATSETCFQIQDTGLGPVGCCPNGNNCGGTITDCNAPNTACADTLGGGCCIPNYVCAGVGCVMTSTATEIVTQTSTLLAASSSSAQSTQTVITIITPVTSTTTPPVSTISTSTYTGLQTTLACSTNSHPCPVDMGGGCCGNGYTCASQSSCIATSTIIITTSSSASVTGVVPVRPTGDTTSTTSSTDVATTCPVGFYACEAYYAGGCCRTGRNCETTSCPATSSTTIISSGVTVVVPLGAAATTTSPSGNCASGWFTCAASLGGNCCPMGYGCGTTSCSLTDATSTAVSPKKAPNGAGRLERGSLLLILGALAVVLVLI